MVMGAQRPGTGQAGSNEASFRERLEDDDGDTTANGALGRQGSLNPPPGRPGSVLPPNLPARRDPALGPSQANGSQGMPQYHDTYNYLFMNDVNENPYDGFTTLDLPLDTDNHAPSDDYQMRVQSPYLAAGLEYPPQLRPNPSSTPLLPWENGDRQRRPPPLQQPPPPPPLPVYGFPTGSHGAIFGPDGSHGANLQHGLFADNRSNGHPQTDSGGAIRGPSNQPPLLQPRERPPATAREADDQSAGLRQQPSSNGGRREKQPRRSKPTTGEGSQFRCRCCDIPHGSHQKMLRHENMMERKFLCETCNKPFGSRADLRRHVNEVHGSKNLLCGERGCERAHKGFPRRLNLQNHYRTKHGRELPEDAPPISLRDPTRRRASASNLVKPAQMSMGTSNGKRKRVKSPKGISPSARTARGSHRMNNDLQELQRCDHEFERLSKRIRSQRSQTDHQLATIFQQRRQLTDAALSLLTNLPMQQQGSQEAEVQYTDYSDGNDAESLHSTAHDSDDSGADSEPDPKTRKM